MYVFLHFLQFKFELLFINNIYTWTLEITIPVFIDIYIYPL